MMKGDLQRIEAFCNVFELSADQLFSLIGYSVCHIGRLKLNAGEDCLQYIEMDSYIYNELLNSGYIKEGD